ncbi:Nucleic-acid-binding protein from transposon X-element [Eumeta japonica]|uniref:Nucleic-acid-binding protein from transposon X-element n=1 Tax=Eumeta variegata TaxID=151549 RepID=A0A4C2AC50_EUMVA|nr:Nucleic-acid-binding protein from transposon X-element [Eumeta japonica]
MASQSGSSRGRENNRGDEADVTAPHPHRVAKPPPMFVQDKDRWTELRRRGVPKEIPVDEVKEDLVAQSLPVQSVRRILNRFRKPLDLVLVSGTAEANDKATKAAFFKIRSVCSLSGVKAEQPRKRALPGQCHNCQSYGHSSRYCYHSARCVKCLGDHGTAQCTRNKDTDGPPACVLCKQKGHTANYLGCPRAPKRPPPPEKAVPRRAPARAVSAAFSYARAAAGPRNAPPPQRTLLHPLTIWARVFRVISITHAASRSPRLRGRAECCVRVEFHRASPRFSAYRTAIASPAPFFYCNSFHLPHDPAHAPRGRRVASPAVLRERSATAEHSRGYRNGA